MCRYSGMYAGTSTPVISGCSFPQMPVPVGTLSAGAGRTSKCRWRLEPSMPVVPAVQEGAAGRAVHTHNNYKFGKSDKMRHFN